MRSFVAIDLDKANRNLLADWLDERSREDKDIRWVPAEQSHLTLQFLGDVSSETLAALALQLSEQLRDKHSFELFPRGVQTLGRPPRVLCVSFALQPYLLEIVDVVRECSRALKIDADTKPFLAHLTLGRVRDEARLDAERIERLRASLPELQPWRIEAVHIKESQLGKRGAVHRIIRSVPLDD